MELSTIASPTTGAVLAAPSMNISPLRSRFSEAPWFKRLQDKTIMVIGAGGIGSWVCMCLARIGCRLVVIDHDMIETHNLGGQMFMANQVNTPKVQALAANCRSFAGDIRLDARQYQYADVGFITPIVIMAVDNMKTRKEAFEAWKSNLPGNEGAAFSKFSDTLFIDGRLLAEDYQVYAVTPDRIREYEETLFDDAEIPTEQCTLKSTTHCSLGIASDIIGVLTNFMANKTTLEDPLLGVELRDVPFKIVKSIPNFMYDVTLINGKKEDKAGAEDSSSSTKSDSSAKEEGTNHRGVPELHLSQPKV